CKGGRFEELVTEELNNCSKVDGNLEFINMAEVPLSMNLLTSVRRIKGALRIENSPAFTTFTYLPNLRKIENKGEGPALTVENNENLEDIDFPSLTNFSSKHPPWIVIRNNPVLVLSGRFGEMLRGLKQKHKQLVVLDDASSILENATWNMDGNITTDASSDIYSGSRNWIFVVVAILLVILVPLLCCATMCKLKGKQLFRYGTRMSNFLPYPNYNLNEKQRLVLRSLCEDVLTMNTLSWRTEELGLLCQHEKDCKCEKIEKVLKRYENIIKENMIQVAENGSLSLVLGDTPRASKSQRLISERIQKMLVMKHVVLIGTEDDPSCVLPKIPTTPGKDRTYEYDTTKMTLRFKNSMEVSNNSRRFEYDAEFTSENKTRLFKLEFVYFVWGSLDLNVNVEELLRLLQFCKIPGHSLCVSNRHKEVFSLLNLFYSFVVRAETPVQLTDVFKIHNAKCNGCMLDRHEMIFSMKFLLVWGIQSGALPKLHQAANSWLDTYDGMAAFQKIHPNVVSFHPFFIPDLFPEDMEEIVKAGGCDPPKFSDRMEYLMRDRFTYQAEGVDVTDFEKNVEVGKKKRLELEKSLGIDRQTTTTMMEVQPDEEEATIGSKKRRKDEAEDYWASKEKQILELKAKREGRKMVQPESSRIPSTEPSKEKVETVQNINKQTEHGSSPAEALARFIDKGLDKAPTNPSKEKLPGLGQQVSKTPIGKPSVPQESAKAPSKDTVIGAKGMPTPAVGKVGSTPANLAKNPNIALPKSIRILATAQTPRIRPAVIPIHQVVPKAKSQGKLPGQIQSPRLSKDMKR
ncbi:hypothetical protein V3C99_012930, partial [Haemonchus contortus]